MKKYKSMLMIVTASIFLSACSAPKTMFPVSGSRADGTIKMAYNYQEFESPVVDMRKAKRDAIKKCQTWGYDSAEAFGGQTQRCINGGGFSGCSKTEVVVEYQCMGDLSGL
jgi:hypothetical protein